MGTRRANGAGSLFKRNGWFYFRYIDENGKTFCRSCKTKIKAEAEDAVKDFSFGAELPQKVRLSAIQEFLKDEKTNPLLTDAFAAYQSHPRNLAQPKGAKDEDSGIWKSFTRWLYGQNIHGRRTNCKGKHVQAKRIDDITEEIATEFITEYKASPHTKNRFVRVLSRIWKFNSATSNPWANFRKFRETPAKRRSLTKEEVDKLISSASGELRLLFIIGAYTGLRMQDSSRIRWEYLSKDLSLLTMTPHKTKHSSGVIVNIPVHRKLIEELSSIPGKNTGWVMPHLAEMNKWELSDVVQSHFKACGLIKSIENSNYRNKTPSVGFHSLRSTFISNCADAGIPLAFVQSLVGHVSPELTQLYYRANAEHARGFIDRL